MKASLLERIVILPLVVLMASLWLVVGGCTQYADPDLRPRDYVLVYLASGPKSGQGDKAERQKMFEGHMANIRRLADEKKVVIAGPFEKPTDKTWRGILMFAVSYSDEALDLAGTDPAVQAGEFTCVARRMRANRGLMQTLAIEKQLDEEFKQNPPPNESTPPKRLRRYVMVTSKELLPVWDAMTKAGLPGRLVWWAAFSEGGGGVSVFDSDDVEAVRAALSGVSGCTVDAWWSSTSLMKLKRMP